MRYSSALLVIRRSLADRVRFPRFTSSAYTISARSTASRLTPDAETLTTVGPVSSDGRTVTDSSCDAVVEKRTSAEGQEAYPASTLEEISATLVFYGFEVCGLRCRRDAVIVFRQDTRCCLRMDTQPAARALAGDTRESRPSAPVVIRMVGLLGDVETGYRRATVSLLLRPRPFHGSLPGRAPLSQLGVQT